MTPMSDSGSDSRMANGSRNDPNWTTSTKYISSSATPSATRMRVNTSCWSFVSPPCEIS